MPTIPQPPMNPVPSVTQIFAGQRPNPMASIAAAHGTDAGYQHIDAQRQQAETKQIEGYKAILASPQQAETIAKMYGIPFTPTLQAAIQQPIMLQNIIAASEFGKKMGIENPQAISNMMMIAAQQAQKGQPFNPVEVMGGADGMDPRAPMSHYQEGYLKDFADRTTMQGNRPGPASRGPNMQHAALQPWKDPRVPVQLRMEGEQLVKQVAGLANNPLATDDDKAAINKAWQDYTAKVAPFMDGAGQGLDPAGGAGAPGGGFTDQLTQPQGPDNMPMPPTGGMPAGGASNLTPQDAAGQVNNLFSGGGAPAPAMATPIAPGGRNAAAPAPAVPPRPQPTPTPGPTYDTNYNRSGTFEQPAADPNPYRQWWSR